MTNQEKAKELLAIYNEYEEKLYSGGNDYRDIPEHAWGDLEFQIQKCGFEVVQPKQGYSTIKLIEE